MSTKLTKKSSPSQVVRSWVRRLRSGKYKQAKSKLHVINGDNHSFCCLGVLCELAYEAGLVKKDENEYRAGAAYYSTYLPPVVRKWASLDNASGSCIRKNEETSLAILNDSGKYSFKKIANIIESKPLNLFTTKG